MAIENKKETYVTKCEVILKGSSEASGPGAGVRVMWGEARRGATGACAGAVLLTTSVMAALEPCLPLWIMHKFHPEVNGVHTLIIFLFIFEPLFMNGLILDVRRTIIV